ncbi:heat shock protein HslJ [Leucobacter exalbidus]|uniref:Heat shock protein HslJ n=1 Tax=Leucobacter exalbidus TaxID=662960 RepID=A0A940PW70_9MICO|nr:META domain-containing protein [Leucobacter exalbidus]MBP1327365.1 heat shock protein HslJ [Leucobacter exalbidus]
MRLSNSQTPSKRFALRTVLAASALVALTLTGCSSSSGDVTGSWGDAETQGQPALELGTDGKLSGTDGCNRLMGDYTEKDGGVEFGQIASTMMFCEGVDTWLGKAATATVSGDKMTVLDKDGAEIGTLKRSEG